jgi:hypothetical protein
METGPPKIDGELKPCSKLPRGLLPFSPWDVLAAKFPSATTCDDEVLSGNVVDELLLGNTTGIYDGPDVSKLGTSEVASTTEDLYIFARDGD